MDFSGVRRWGLLIAITAVGCWAPGCATLRHPGSKDAAAMQEETARKQMPLLLAMTREAGWQEVQDILLVLDEQPPEDFPGVSALIHDLHRLEGGAKDSHGVPPVDAEQVIDRNPHFWNAFYEIAPGDPLMSTLHVGLLLAAGEAARADRVATLAINFGRMAPDFRKELVRLDTFADLMLQVSQSDAVARQRLRQAGNFGTMADQARAALSVWPQNPEAWADLAAARRLAGPTAGDASEARASLQRVDPLFEAGPDGAKAEPVALADVRRLWNLIDEGKATGDDEMLERFGGKTQAAGLDELALVARSLLAGWRNGAGALEENFARTSLDRLIGSQPAADLCAAVFGEERDWLGFNKETDPPPANLEGVSVHPQLEQRLLVTIAEASYWIESGLAQGDELAADYGERGEAWAQLRQKEVALEDLRRSLQLQPANNAIRFTLAVTLSDAGDFQEADTVFAEALKRGSPGVFEMQAWGNHLFKQGRFAEAEAAYAKAGQLDAGFAYSRIMQNLARLRQGRPGLTKVDGRVGRDDPWGASLLGFLAGRIDEKVLFSRLEPQGGLRYSEQECELYFVLAQLALSRGDIAAARRDLHACLGTGITTFVEYAMAWHELRRLDAAHPPPQGKTPAGDSADDEQPA
jgi:lipoprotein NlpI